MICMIHSFSYFYNNLSPASKICSVPDTKHTSRFPRIRMIPLYHTLTVL